MWLRSEAATRTYRHPVWSQLAGRFPEDRECIASFLAFESAEVISEVKPGNLVNIVNRPRPCGRNLYSLWRTYGPALPASANLLKLELCDRGDSLLLYIYNRNLLLRVLQHPAVIKTLRKTGYDNPSDLDRTLEQLRERLAGPFPHEIGFFLGYPIKDVLGFMGCIDLPFACQGPWKIYGKPEQSMALADTHRECRSRMAWHLAHCSNPLQCLMQAA